MGETSKQNVFTDPNILQSKSYKISQEVFNAITHGLGFVLSVLGTIVLIRKAVYYESVISLVAYLIFGISMSLLYFNSTLYHSLKFTKVGPIFQVFDHVSIYLLIAGTYTPIALLTVGGRQGLILVLLEWAIALVGMEAKISQRPWIKKYSTLVYLLMGWLGIFAIRPVFQNMELAGILWIVAGGLFYTIGTYFYSKDDRVAYYHVIWHLFVLAGSFCMYMSILLYV